ncbi:MAG: class I SAM-dependent methyltransferase [Phycisphaeraceae bacterium]
MSNGSFNDLTDIFESIIDWRKRLAHETPFYRHLFERFGIKRVVDVACGTGHHAAMFHSWGLQVQGADLSPNMIARARATYGQPPGLAWVVRGFDQPIELDDTFDAAVCVGNSLALAPNRATAQEAVRCMLAAVRRGGVAVVHVLNVWALPDGPCVWQKAVHTTLPEGPALIVKGVHRCAGSAYVELLVCSLDGQVKMRSTSVPFLALEEADLEQVMRESGCHRIYALGGYQDQPFDRAKSIDLVLVAEK